jgi:hypothetical protein
LRESDLQAGVINHMLRMELPMDMLQSYSSSVTQLAPNAWPQTQEDGFAVNGNGGPAYTGTIPYGVTIGIPSTAVEPAAVKANAGANMLWTTLRNHGAMVRDSGGSGNTVIFQADQQVSGDDPLLQGMEQYGALIMAQTQILANQGANSVNGGGTPIVALNPAPNDMPLTSTPTPTPPVTMTPSNTVVMAGSPAAIVDAAGNTWTITAGGQVAVNGQTDSTTANVTEIATVNNTIYQENTSNLWWGKTTATAAWAGGSATSPLPGNGSVTASGTTATVSQSGISVSLAAGSTMLFVSGTHDTFDLSGSTQQVSNIAQVSDTGSGNTYILPAAGHGEVSFTKNILAVSDTVDLRPALAATSWNGSASTLATNLTVTTAGSNAVLSVTPASGGSAVAIAVIDGAGGTSLNTLLAHALT